jgi:hypothetical protein
MKTNENIRNTGKKEKQEGDSFLLSLNRIYLFENQKL